MKKFSVLAAAAALACLWACETKEDIQAEITVSPASVTFEADGGTLRVAVTTNIPEYTVSGAANWLTVEKSGKEIALTAAANTVNQTRSCTLKVTAQDVSFDVAVSQKPGSPYPGYTVMSTASFEYAGTMMYMFLKPTEENYGGQGYYIISDEDGNFLSLWAYTELYKTEEDVKVGVGTYTKGADEYPILAAKPYTYMSGSVQTFADDGDEEESYVSGSFYFNMATGEEIPIVDGSFTITIGNEGHTIKTDLKDADGKDYKFVFTGEVELDAEGAGYPTETERIDVANTVHAVGCNYMGDTYETGNTTYQVVLASGDPEDPALSIYELILGPADFTTDIDLSGTYTTPEEEADLYTPGTLVPGQMMEIIPGFSMPMGTYIMYSLGDYLIGDGYDSLILEKQPDGTYNLMGAIMSAGGDLVFFNLEGVEIEIMDGRED